MLSNNKWRQNLLYFATLANLPNSLSSSAVSLRPKRPLFGRGAVASLSPPNRENNDFLGRGSSSFTSSNPSSYCSSTAGTSGDGRWSRLMRGRPSRLILGVGRTSRLILDGRISSDARAIWPRSRVSKLVLADVGSMGDLAEISCRTISMQILCKPSDRPRVHTNERR